MSCEGELILGEGRRIGGWMGSWLDLLKEENWYNRSLVLMGRNSHLLVNWVKPLNK